ncbi:hypothetical protein Golax_018413, partial [Gossypium laxum]|nr:hypothetical protein [Gossypium laxum]
MELNASAGRFMICSAAGLPKFPRLLMIRYEHVLYMKVNGAREGFIISWNYDHDVDAIAFRLKMGLDWRLVVM